MIDSNKIAEWKGILTQREEWRDRSYYRAVGELINVALPALLSERDDMIALLRGLEKFFASIAIPDRVDSSDWNLIRGKAGAVRDQVHVFLADGR